MNGKYRILVASAGVLVVAATAMVGIGQAQAAPSLGCEWPRVCFYKTEADFRASRPTAAYQDITSTWQTLGSRSKGSYGVFNSREDDGARLYFAGGATRCVKPGEGLYDMPRKWGSVEKIRIMDSEDC